MDLASRAPPSGIGPLVERLRSGDRLAPTHALVRAETTQGLGIIEDAGARRSFRALERLKVAPPGRMRPIVSFPGD